MAGILQILSCELTIVFVAMLPVIELQGAISLGVLLPTQPAICSHN